MDIKKVRNDFLIFVVDDEVSIREILMESLTGAGFQVMTFPSAEDALAKMSEIAPHVILSDIRMPGMNGIQLLEKVRSMSEDIQFIIMTSHASLDTAVNAMRLGAYDYLNKPFEELEDVIKTVDRTIEKLYLKFQNEQLLSELESKNDALIHLNARISKEKEEVVLINNLMSDLAKAKDVNDVVQIYLNHTKTLTGAPVMFLKYLPSYSSLVVSHASGIEMETIKRVGVSFKGDDHRQVHESIRAPQGYDKLRQMMSEIFKNTAYLAISIEISGAVTGIVVCHNPVSDTSVRRLFDSFTQIFKIFFSSAQLQQKIHEMAIKDPLTGLYNRRYFNERLEAEISRSRRTRHAVALIYMDIDNFKSYNDQNGHPMGDVLIRMVATILMKTCRKNDVVARIGGEEFVIVLPHTTKEGAAIKAEKLRRTIWATDFPHGEKQPMGRVSMSFGVSEYPSLANDQESLIQAADGALYQAKQTTRNRVCLAAAPEGFKPDFEPIPIEPYSKEGR